MILKIEPFSGISGDMMLGALVDLTVAGDDLAALPGRLNLAGASIEIGRTSRRGIACTRVVVVDETEPVTRHLADIHAIIDRSDLDDTARTLARRVFAILGEAEATVHGIALEKVHFHEVGAVDSILDIVGTAMLMSRLDLTGVVCGPVCTGHGFVDCDHGRLPVPAPATEMTTPTGAAILRALEPSFAIGEHTTIASGYGAGARDLEQPDCLRLAIARPATMILEETTTIGVRYHPVARTVLPRAGVPLQRVMREAQRLADGGGS